MKPTSLPPLHYAAIRNVEATLNRQPALMQDLVAVYTKGDGAGALLVYNRDQPPALPHSLEVDGWHARPLERLRADEYAGFDGPVLTLAALDVLLDDIPTHGVYFYPLEDLAFFTAKEHQPVFLATASRLVQTAARRWLQLPPLARAQRRPLYCKRIAQLCLPAALAAFSDPALVALRFDFTCLEDLAPSQGGNALLPEGLVKPVFNRQGAADDIRSLGELGEDEWAACFKEIQLLVAGLNAHAARLLPFRPSLRRFEGEARITATCRQLALRCWAEWQTNGNQQVYCAAYTLAAEAWLQDQDATDIVAILPDADFEQFALDSAAQVVSRGPVCGPAAKEGRYSLEDILQGRSAVGKRPAFAIPVLANALRQRGATTVFDLGPLLQQAERYTDLARTFWLLSRDLLHIPSQDWLQIGASPDDVTNLAQRAAAIYGLSNPWVWRQGRYNLLIVDCYAHLDHCLEGQEQAAHGKPLAFYYAALRAWFGCALEDDIRGNLVRVADLGRTFVLACEDINLSNEASDEIATMNSLINAAERLLPRVNEPGATQQQFTSVAQLLRSVADCAKPVPLPSPMFEYWSQVYLDADRQWQIITVEAGRQRPDALTLSRLQEELIKWQRRAFAPYHELRALNAAFEIESEQVRRLQAAVGEGAMIKVFVRTGEVSFGSKQTIAFEIQNNGNHAASSLTWRLERFSGFTLESKQSQLEAIDLRPGERRHAEIQVRATEPTLTLAFRCRYRDRAGRLQTSEDHATLRARNYVLGPRTKINPFEVGRPVKGSVFFDRNEVIKIILTRLAKGDTHPLVLRGPRRIGKSSLLWRIAAVLEHPADARDYGLPSEMQAALQVLHPVRTSLQKLALEQRYPLKGFLLGLLQNICRQLAVDVQPVTAAFLQGAKQILVADAFLIQVRAVLEQRPRQRVVVLLDELDNILGDSEQGTTRQLRDIIQEEQRISWITASTMLIKNSLGATGSAPFNMMEPLELRAMDWDGAHQLVKQLGGGAGYDWSDPAITTVLNLAGQRPYLIQLLGARTTDDVNARGGDRIESDDVDAAVVDLLEEISLTGSYLGFVWNEAQWLGRLMLWHLLATQEQLSDVKLSRCVWEQIQSELGSRTISHACFYEAFKERLDWLREIADVLEATPNTNHLRFSIPLIRRLLQRKFEREDEFTSRAIHGVATELGA